MVWHAVHHLETNHHDHPTGPAWDDASHQASSVQIGGLPSGEDHPHLAFPILVRPEFKAGAAGTALPPRTMRWEMVGTVVRAPQRTGISARGSPAQTHSTQPRAPPSS